jgi:glycosyltransferase involved in cell wall biosynthesis
MTRTSDNLGWRFPEHWFPCRPEQEVEYQRLVDLGKRFMLEHTVAFCCLARSLGAIAPLTISRIKSLASAFGDYSVFVIENDSDDDTPKILEEWAAEDRKVAVCSEQLGIHRFPQDRCLERATHMAGIRNKYLHQLRSYANRPDYVIVLDTDLEGGWSEEGIANTFGHGNWDAVGSNGLFAWRGKGLDKPARGGLVHFDAWAFRSDGQPESHPFGVVNKYVFCRGESMMPVFSCFGGLSIYRSEAIADNFYSGEDCEHVPFHRRMRESGFGRIFLNPSQIALYSSLRDVCSIQGLLGSDPRISLDLL